MNKTVLIIDNDETTVELQQFFFNERGYTAYTALDGDAGVGLALRHRPAVIICDLIMGRMHGFEVLQVLRSHPELARTIVIVTSAKAYKPDMDRARELGATDYVVKPFHLEELLALVERHLDASGTH